MRKTLQRTFGLLFFALVGVMTGTAQNSFPYSVDFTTAGDLAGWTAVDDSPTKGVTWEYGTGTYSQAEAASKMCAIMKEDAASKHVDYLVSPEFTATAGATYYISIKAQYKGYAMCGVQVGKSATDMSANAVISDDVASSFGKYYNGWFDYNGVEQAKTAKVAYTATEDGPLYFSLYAHSNSSTDDGSFFFVYGIDIEEDKPGPKALPYSVDLGDNQRGWAAIDASDVPGVTWTANEFYDNSSTKYMPAVVNGYDWENTWNDYYVSPAFTLEAGKSYKVKTRTWKNTDPSAFTLSLMLGTSQTDASTFQKITDLSMQATYDATATEDHVFAVKKSGDYNLAFLATTTTGTNEQVALCYFDIAETDETPEVTLGGAVETTALPYNITFDSADKFATWSTLDNSDVPGKTWEFNTSDFAGKPSAFMGPDAGSATCDWLISPKFELKEGKSYVIKFDGATGADNATSVILDYFEGSKDKDNFKTITWIGEKLPKMEGEEAKTEWTVDINKDGGYYFAFRALNWTPNQETDAISIYSFSVAEAPEGEPETPVALPYETSFLEETGAAGWTAMDRSDNVSSTWSWNSWGYDEYDENWQPVGENHPCVGFSSDWGTNANDYFVSPLFTLEAGKTYVVKTHTATNRSCFNDKTTSFTMKLGTNKKVQGTFTQSIGDIELNTVYDRDPSVFEFIVEESGNYYVAYNISDPDGSKAYGYIFDFSLAEKTAEVQPVATTPVTDLAATEAGDLKTIKLKWKNPTKDVEGNDLAADAELSVKVFEGETLLTTVAGAPGAEGSYSYEPETYAGLHEYKVVVVYNELESEAATTTLTVVVNGINGAIVIPADAEVSVRTLGGALVGNNFSALAKGTYLVTVKTVDGKVKTMKVTK